MFVSMLSIYLLDNVRITIISRDEINRCDHQHPTEFSYSTNGHGGKKLGVVRSAEESDLTVCLLGKLTNIIHLINLNMLNLKPSARLCSLPVCSGR